MAKFISKKKLKTSDNGETASKAEAFYSESDVPGQVARKSPLGEGVPGKETSKENKTGAEDFIQEEYVSYVIPHRRLKKAAKRLVRSNKLLLAALGFSIIILIMFAISFMQENLGGFTINLNTVQMYRKGISLDTDDTFKNATSRLKIPTLKRGTNISINDIDFDKLKDINGDASAMDYIAYGFYLKNGGIDPVNYTYCINCVTKAKGAEKAIRVAVCVNGEWTVYAAPKADGTPEDGTEVFVSTDTIMESVCKDFQVGAINKYVIVMWLDGDDPDCTDDIIGGGIKMTMDFDTGKHEKVSLKDYFKHLPVFRVK